MTQVIQSHFMLGVLEAAEKQGASLSATELKEVAQRLIDERAHGFSAYHASKTDPAAIADDVRAVLSAIKPKAAPKPADAHYGVSAEAWRTMTNRQRLDQQRKYERENGKRISPRVNSSTEATLLAERRGFQLLANGISGPRREAALKGVQECDRKLRELRG